MDPLARKAIGDVAILVLRSSNPVRVSACFRLQFEKRIYIIDEETALTRLRILLNYGVFVHLDDLNDLISLVQGHPNFLYVPRTCESPLRKRLLSEFAIRVALGGARPTQAEHQSAIAAIYQHWMVESLGRQDATFYRSLFP